MNYTKSSFYGLLIFSYFMSTNCSQDTQNVGANTPISIKPESLEPNPQQVHSQNLLQVHSQNLFDVNIEIKKVRPQVQSRYLLGSPIDNQKKPSSIYTKIAGVTTAAGLVLAPILTSKTPIREYPSKISDSALNNQNTLAIGALTLTALNILYTQRTTQQLRKEIKRNEETQNIKELAQAQKNLELEMGFRNTITKSNLSEETMELLNRRIEKVKETLQKELTALDTKVNKLYLGKQLLQKFGLEDTDEVLQEKLKAVKTDLNLVQQAEIDIKENTISEFVTVATTEMRPRPTFSLKKMFGFKK